jgi:hypothetical protein
MKSDSSRSHIRSDISGSGGYRQKCSQVSASPHIRCPTLTSGLEKLTEHSKVSRPRCHKIDIGKIGRIALFGNLNFDESRWRLAMTTERTVAERGVESVKRYVNGNLKASFTLFASILANGTKPPLILIATGRIKRCYRQFSNTEPFNHKAGTVQMAGVQCVFY